jgi:hypothetical protein
MMRNRNVNRFLLRLACCLPFFGALLLINWISVQPPVRRLFTRTLDAQSEALVAGKTIWSQADMLDLKPVWLEHVQVHPDVVILGTSRVVQIRQEWFRPRKMLNLALFAGDFTDMVAIMQECLESGKTPRLVLLELNPTLTFEGKIRVEPGLSAYFRHALEHYGIFPPLFFSGPLTLEGVRWNPQMFFHPNAWGISDRLPSGGYLVRPDGSTDWYDTERRLPKDEVDRVVASEMEHLNGVRQRWRAASKPEWFQLRILRSFLDDLHSRGIRVVVVLVPVHPLAFDSYFRRGGYDDSWIRQEMASHGVPVIGAFSPAVAKATGDEFVDDVHARPEVLHRLLQESGTIE